MTVQAAQPALLYIVPAVLASVSIHSLLKSEFSQLWTWSEEVVEEETEETEAEVVVGESEAKSAVKETRKEK